MASVDVSSKFHEASSHPNEGPPFLEDADGKFERYWNRASFRFSHKLSGHPLFELDSLVELSRRMPKCADFAYWSNGTEGPGNHWGTRGKSLSLPDTIAGIAENNSLVLIKHAWQDEVYGPVLQSCLSEAVELCGDQLRDDVILGNATILIASPNRVTPYHIDWDCNFLMQIAGDKKLHVFNGADRTLLTVDELEGFCSGNINSAIYQPAREKDAAVYDLGAGDGVHVPVHAPHWAQNGDNISVALSVNYELRSEHRKSDLYQLQHWGRRAGLKPRGPERAGLAWQAAAVALRTARGLRKLIRPSDDGVPTLAAVLTPVGKLLPNFGATTGRIIYLRGSAARNAPAVPFSRRLLYKALGRGAITSASARNADPFKLIQSQGIGSRSEVFMSARFF